MKNWECGIKNVELFFGPLTVDKKKRDASNSANCDTSLPFAMSSELWA